MKYKFSIIVDNNLQAEYIASADSLKTAKKELKKAVFEKFWDDAKYEIISFEEIEEE